MLIWRPHYGRWERKAPAVWSADRLACWRGLLQTLVGVHAIDAERAVFFHRRSARAGQADPIGLDKRIVSDVTQHQQR